MSKIEMCKAIIKHVQHRLDSNECQRLEIELGIMLNMLTNLSEYTAEDAVEVILKEAANA